MVGFIIPTLPRHFSTGASRDLPIAWKLKCRFIYTPHYYGLPAKTSLLRLARCPERLCLKQVLPPSVQYPTLHQPTLLGLLRSYALMRQTKSLPLTSIFYYTEGLCRLSPVPAGRWPFPTLSLQSSYGCLDLYPVTSLRCSCPFLPEELRPHNTPELFGTSDIPAKQFHQG